MPIVDIEGMFAQLALANGPLMIPANQGRYDLDAQKVDVNGPVRVVGPDGYRLETRDVRSISSPAAGELGSGRRQMRLGQFQAGRSRPISGTRSRAGWRCSLENRPRGGQMMTMRTSA